MCHYVGPLKRKEDGQIYRQIVREREIEGERKRVHERERERGENFMEMNGLHFMTQTHTHTTMKYFSQPFIKILCILRQT